MLRPSVSASESVSPDCSLNLMVQALLAREGFAEVAAIAGRLVGARVQVLVPRPGSEGKNGTAAERFVADLVAGGMPAWPVGVGEVVPIVVAGRVQGAVIVDGVPAPGAVEHLHSAARAALTGIAILDAREETRRDSSSGLLADLLAGRELERDEIVARASQLGCDLDAGFVAMVVFGRHARGQGDVAATVGEVHPTALAEVIDGIVHVLVPGREIDAEALEERLGDAVLRAHSAPYTDPAEAARALDEARTLLALVKISEVNNTDRQTWDSLRIPHGAYFHEPLRMEEFAARTVGKLIERDQAEAGRLQETFWAYQQTNCNMNEAAERLETHRHTVANRLRRIRELTDLDPQRGYDRELLGLALRAHLVISHSSL